MTQNEEYINFDMYAEKYDNTRKVSEHVLDLFGKKLREMVNNRKSILEIACGTGRITEGLINNDFSVVGLDVSEKMLEKAIAKASKNSWDFTSILCDARFAPLRKNSFDLVITLHILHLIRDWEKVLSEIIRCLKPNGAYIFSELSRNYYKTPPFIEYWKFFNERYDTTKTNRIGLKNNDILHYYLKKLGYCHSFSEYEEDVKIDKKLLIQTLNGKFMSSQRYIEEKNHIEAVNHLKKNNYFLSEEDRDVNVSEGFKIWVYTTNT